MISVFIVTLQPIGISVPGALLGSLRGIEFAFDASIGCDVVTSHALLIKMFRFALMKAQLCIYVFILIIALGLITLAYLIQCFL